MSYCRFENTLADMEDCLEALQNGVDVEELSSYEISALGAFADVAREISRYEDTIEYILEKYERLSEE